MVAVAGDATKAIAGPVVRTVGNSLGRVTGATRTGAKRAARAVNHRFKSTAVRLAKGTDPSSAARLADGTVLSDNAVLEAMKFLEKIAGHSDEAMEAMIRGGFKNGAAVDDLMIIASRADTKGFLDDIATIVGEDPRLAEHVGDCLGYLRRHAKGKPVGRAVPMTPVQRLPFVRAGAVQSDFIKRSGRTSQADPFKSVMRMMKTIPGDSPAIGPFSSAMDALADLAKVHETLESPQTSIGMLAMLKRLKEQASSAEPDIGNILAIRHEAIAAKRVIDGHVNGLSGVRVRNVGMKVSGDDLDLVIDNVVNRGIAPDIICLVDAKTASEAEESIKKSLAALRAQAEVGKTPMHKQLGRLEIASKQLPGSRTAIGSDRLSFYAINANEVGTSAYDSLVAVLSEFTREPGGVASFGRWELLIID